MTSKVNDFDSKDNIVFSKRLFNFNAHVKMQRESQKISILVFDGVVGFGHLFTHLLQHLNIQLWSATMIAGIVLKDLCDKICDACTMQTTQQSKLEYPEPSDDT